MAETDPRDAFVESFVAKFADGSRGVAEAQLAQATGAAREAWVAIIAALDARGEHLAPPKR